MSVRKTAWIAMLAIAAGATAIGSSASGADRPAAKVHWALLPGSLPAVAVPQVQGAHERTFFATDFVATSIDNDPAGASQGDELAVSGRLRNSAGDAIGRLEVHEVLTSASPQLIQLTATLRFHRSQIEAAGVQGTNPETGLAVVGGTGLQRMVGAGQLTAEPASNNRVKLTVVLLR